MNCTPKPLTLLLVFSFIFSLSPSLSLSFLFLSFFLLSLSLVFFLSFPPSLSLYLSCPVLSYIYTVCHRHSSRIYNLCQQNSTLIKSESLRTGWLAECGSGPAKKAQISVQTGQGIRQKNSSRTPGLPIMWGCCAFLNLQHQRPMSKRTGLGCSENGGTRTFIPMPFPCFDEYWLFLVRTWLLGCYALSWVAANLKRYSYFVKLWAGVLFSLLVLIV